MRGRISATAALCERDFKLWKSYRMRWVTTVFTAVAGVTLFYYVSRLVNAPEVGDADDYFGFVVVGTAILQMLTSTLTGPIGTLRSELMTGNFERLVVSPFGPVGSIVSMTIFPMLLGLAVSVITLVFAALAFGLDLSGPEALLAIPVSILGALAFAPFGLLMAALALLFKGTNAGATFVVTGLSLVAGLYFPVSLLPDWIRWVSDVQPFTPAADLLRDLLLDTPADVSVAGSLVTLIAFAIVMLPVATLVLRAAVAKSRRDGTITEY